MAASSSTTSSSWVHDVFLNFRGPDTRHNFTRPLYHALRQSGIHVFMDDTEIKRVEEIYTSLMQGIERSRIALVIFSPNYAFPKWCLDELTKIMECQKTQAQVVIPIFYEVDPADVSHQRGTYGEAMKQHEQRFGRKSPLVLRWRKALKAAANLAGFVSANLEQTLLTEKIVEVVCKNLDVGQLSIADHPVEIESRVQELTTEWSKKISQKSLIVGLWGMGGLGKTTIAKAIYNKIGCEFRARSFLADIRENSKHANDIVNLQKQLISDITKTQVFRIPNVDSGKNIIHERFRHIKAFVVLDDVDSVNQLQEICGSLEWFCSGSAIVITTRDKHILDALKADYQYPVKEMNKIESLELFKWHAFKQETPSAELIELCNHAVDYCGGIPLALELLGSHLRERTVEEWEAIFSKLKSVPNKDIQAKLRISYDGLNDYMEKEIFLDICCFFINKDRNYVTQILDACRLHAENGLQTLIERSLVKVNRNNKFEMHDLLQGMGKEIVRESSPKDPEKRSRLWFREDVLDVLTEHTGTKAIEGIYLKIPRTHRNQCLIDSKAFKKMRKLKLLRLDYVNLEGDYEHLSRRMRWLCWHGFPLKYTPKNLYQQKLVAIDFKYSKLEVVWKEPQLLEMLKTLNLSHSHYLKETPDFTYLPSLEKLVMKDCPSLILIHESIGDLKNLLHINLEDCKVLKDLPRSIYKLKTLKTLILSGCLLIDHLEEDIEQMESLTTLIADNTSIMQGPFSLVRLGVLVQHGYVSLCGYEGRAQDIFPSLIWSWASPEDIPQSHNTEKFVETVSSIFFSVGQDGGFRGLSPFLRKLKMLRVMWEECRSKLQLSGKMARILDSMYEANFMRLESSQDMPLISYMETTSVSYEDHDQVHIVGPSDSFNPLSLQMGVCDKADLLKEKILQGRNNGGQHYSHLPGDQYTDWFMYEAEGRSLLFKVPEATGYDLKAMVLSVVCSSCMDNLGTQILIDILIINYTKETVQHHSRDCVPSKEDAEWNSIISSLDPNDIVELVLSVGSQYPVKKIAAYLVYDGSMPRRVSSQKLISVCKIASVLLICAAIFWKRK